MGRTLTDEDVAAVADRVVTLIATRLGAKEPPVPTPAPLPLPAPTVQKLAYTKTELSAELGLSPITIWRLERRGLLRPVPGIRHKLYSRKEIERFLSCREL